MYINLVMLCIEHILLLLFFCIYVLYIDIKFLELLYYYAMFENICY